MVSLQHPTNTLTDWANVIHLRYSVHEIRVKLNQGFSNLLHIVVFIRANCSFIPTSISIPSTISHFTFRPFTDYYLITHDQIPQPQYKIVVDISLIMAIHINKILIMLNPAPIVSYLVLDSKPYYVAHQFILYTLKRN